MTRWLWAVAVLALGVSCSRGDKEGPPRRAEIRRVSGATMEVVPTEGQLPYCLLYTVSEKGVIRQLTMTRENRSLKCEAGRPIANRSFRVPVPEGPVKVYIIFSDQRIQAGSVAQQLYELRDRPRITGIDLRLPGKAFVESLDFTPEEGGTPVTGGVIGEGGEMAEGAPDGVEAADVEAGAPDDADAGTPPGDAGG